MTTESDPASVTTPPPHGYRYAGAWIRLAALIIDSVVLFAVAFALGIGISLFLAIAYPSVILNPSLNMEGWPAGAVAYVVDSALLLGWFGGWQAGVGATPGMLAMKLRVRDASGEDNPSLRAAVTRNSPQVLLSFSGYSGNEDIDALLGIVSLVVCVAIGISISSSPTRQGFHDRLAGGTYVVRPARHR